MDNFTDALMRAKRKATLTGRPITKEEVSGIAEGYAETASQRLARQKQLSLQERGLGIQETHYAALREAARKAEEREKKEATRKTITGVTTAAGVAGGMALGAEWGMSGMALGGGMGAAVGAGAGLIVGTVATGGCIIISSCTSPDSYQVNIAREYRDKFLDDTTLLGYYLLSSKVVHFLNRSKLIRRFFKIFLVKRLVDFGEWALKIKSKRELKTSKFVTENFLALCYAIGYCSVKKEMEVYND